MNQILYYGLQFFLGGATVVGISLIAKYVDPKYTGIVYALPVILIVAMIFIYLNQGINIARKTMRSTMIYEFTLIFFVVVFYFLINRTNFWLALGGGFTSWLIVSILIQLILKL